MASDMSLSFSEGDTFSVRKAIQSRRKPLVSVVIPTRNRAFLVSRAIKSVLAVAADTFECEIIVIDDGSTDETPAVVHTYPVSYIRTNGLGTAGARNAGMGVAQGEFIAFLDDDDEWLPNNIGPQLEFLLLHEEFGAVHAQAFLVDENNRVYSEPVPNGPLRSGWIFDDLLRYWPQIGTFVVRTSVARAIGDLDPTLRGDADWDWILRIAQSSQIGRIAQPLMRFYQRGGPDEALQWRRFPDTVRIFHRRTRHLNFWSRLRVQGIIWKHRGWYAGNFMRSALLRFSAKEYRLAAQCVYYALRCSPVHTLTSFVRLMFARVRSHTRT